MIKHLRKSSIFINHGAGANPILKKQEHKLMYEQFKEISELFPNPKGILIYSAHWEQSQWSIIDQDRPPFYYDYSGYPPEAFNFNYPIGSSLQMRNHVKVSLLKQGIKLKQQKTRGYDHGVYIPLMILYPMANIPVIQMSMLQSLDPEAHFKMGLALRKLKDEGFMILGSGSSSHGAFREPQAIQHSRIFDEELTQLCMGEYNQTANLQKIKNWQKLSYARQLHPRQQHLVPLFINMGASEGPSIKNTKLFLMGLHLSNYIFE